MDLGYSVLGTPLKEDPAFRQTAVEAGVAVDDEGQLQTYLSTLADEYGIKAEDVPTFMDRLRRAIGFEPTAWLGLIAFIGAGLLLTWLPIRASRDTS